MSCNDSDRRSKSLQDLPKGYGMSHKGLMIICCLSLGIMTGCSPVFKDTNNPAFKQHYEAYDYCGIQAVKQAQKNSCGSACLTSVLNYWGIEMTEQEILEVFPKSNKGGYSLVELKQIAKAMGLEAYAISMQDNPVEQLKGQLLKGRPVICAVDFPYMLYFAYDVPIYGPVYRGLVWTLGSRKDHYVVVFGLDSTTFLIIDPVRGFVPISQKDFEACWKEKSYAVLLCVGK